jgi:hypothetical protein
MVMAQTDVQEVVRDVANSELGCWPIAAKKQLTIRHAVGDKDIQSASCFARQGPRTVADGSVRVRVYGRAEQFENPRLVVRDENVIEMSEDLQSVALDNNDHRPRSGEPPKLRHGEVERESGWSSGIEQVA